MREDGVDASELFSRLRELGLTYESRTSTRGVPYAAFRMIGGAGLVEAAVTAMTENGVLRLTSHRIDTPANALEIVQTAARLPLGAAYRSPEDGSAELSVAVFVGDVPLSGSVVARLLDYLVQASTALATGATWLHRPNVGNGAASANHDVRAALAPLGHQLTLEPEGLRMDVALAPGLAGSIVLREDTDCWISAAASFVPEQRLPAGEQALRDLQKLQRWTAAGRLVLDETLVLRAEVSTPLLSHTTARPIVWTASQSAALLQTAARHLGLMP
jgi:hypothetical protein